MNIKIKTKLHKLIREPNMRPHLIKLANRTKNVAIREYKKEMPVDRGFARNSVAARGSGLGFIVNTSAKRDGKLYPLFVHEGTYQFKGARDYGKRSVRRMPLSNLDSGKGIRPNKFADRARETTYQFVLKDMKTLSNKLIKTF